MKLRDYLQKKQPKQDVVNRGPDRELVQKHFNAVARHYDLVNTIMSLGSHYLWKRQAVRRLRPQRGEVLADICGGTADLALLAQRRRDSGGETTLVYDLNLAMMQKGRRKARNSRWGGGLAFVRGDVMDLALHNGSLDGIIVGFGVRNLADPEKGIGEMVRVLKPGGRLVCLEFSRPPVGWFSNLYDLYSGLMMPLMGRLFTGSWHTYEHLASSIRNFPDPAELGRIMHRAGLVEIRWQRLSGGIAAIHWGVKS